MRVKNDDYWTDLVEGVTGNYKTEQLMRLLKGVTLPAGSAVVDIGCGTSILSKVVAKETGLDSIICADYDPQIVAEGRSAETDPRVQWRVADAQELPGWNDRIGAVTFFDVLHEVYSFVGREETGSEIDHERGLKAVKTVLEAGAKALEPGGVIIITDDILPEEKGSVKVRCLSTSIKDVVKKLVAEYPSRVLAVEWDSQANDTFYIPARHFMTLLTQYNKLKRSDLSRWNVERMEVHEYLSPLEYEEFFSQYGLETKVDAGTPKEALDEWSTDFEIVDGLDGFPPKRGTVVATKQS